MQEIKIRANMELYGDYCRYGRTATRHVRVPEDDYAVVDILTTETVLSPVCVPGVSFSDKHSYRVAHDELWAVLHPIVEQARQASKQGQIANGKARLTNWQDAVIVDNATYPIRKLLSDGTTLETESELTAAGLKVTGYFVWFAGVKYETSPGFYAQVQYEQKRLRRQYAV